MKRIITAVAVGTVLTFAAAPAASAADCTPREAWTETVVVTPASTVEHPAITEEIEVVDSEAWTEEIPAVTHEVTHPAVTEEQVITPAVPAVEEVSHTEYEWKWWGEKGHGTKVWGATAPTERLNDVKSWDWESFSFVYGDWRKTGASKKVVDQAYVPGIPAVWGTVTVKDAWTETIVDAEAYTVEHPAVTHLETRVVTEAWTEEIPAVTEEVEHDAIVCPAPEVPADPTETPTPAVVVPVELAPVVTPVASEVSVAPAPAVAAAPAVLAETGAAAEFFARLAVVLLFVGAVCVVFAVRTRTQR